MESPNLEIARQRVGYMIERSGYHLRYQADEYLRFMGRFSDMPGRVLKRRVEEVLQQVGLTVVADQPLTTFSKGMLQRLGLAQALLTRPDLLLIDDALSVLDETEQREFIDILAGVRAQGCTIFICGYYVQSLLHLCDRIGVLSTGRIVAETTGQQLRTQSSNIKIDVDQLSPTLRQQLTGIAPAVTCDGHAITLRPNSRHLQAVVLRALLDAGVTVQALRSLENPLERFYIEALRQVRQIEPPVVVQPLSETRSLPRPDANAPPSVALPTYPDSPFAYPDDEPPLPTLPAHDETYAAPQHRNNDDPLLNRLLSHRTASEHERTSNDESGQRTYPQQ
ncbi:MAG: ABC transporter ATP-binding protein [Chloroflexaceae bacterium]|nr:ABC transporter ATP-binding protein [Chloroflexaceae bacterium]